MPRGVRNGNRCGTARAPQRWCVICEQPIPPEDFAIWVRIRTTAATRRAWYCSSACFDRALKVLSADPWTQGQAPSAPA